MKVTDMLLPRSLPVLVLALLVMPTPAQDSKPTSAATGAALEKSKKKLTPLQRLIRATEQERPKALVMFIEDQVASGAVYAGQYAALEKLDWDVKQLLQVWLLKAPKGVSDRAAYRVGCINALRDLVNRLTVGLGKMHARHASAFVR